MFREHSGNIQGTSREHSWIQDKHLTLVEFLHMEGTFREHLANMEVYIQGTFKKYSGNIQGTF
jgi:hypothetical protein